MKEVIKNNLLGYETLSIDSKVPTLDYLKKDIGDIKRFNVQNISKETFEILKESPHLIKLPYGPFVAGYAALKGKGLHHGGLKLSDDTKEVEGKFIIENNRIIYTPITRFFEEKKYYVYCSGLTYYTIMNMPEILEEYMDQGLKMYVDCGEKVENGVVVPILEEVSEKELYDFATNPEKGKELSKKRRRI